MGTGAWFQGWPCRDVRFRRTRGARADVTTVLFFAQDFPVGFEFVTPTGDLLRATTQAPLDRAALAGQGPPRPLALTKRLEFSGPLVMAETDRLGAEFVVTVDPMFCISLETVRRNVDGSVALVLGRLVDARYFYAQGFLRRWSFNRTDAAGQYARDSVKDSGEPFTLAEIAADVAGSLLATPALAHVPDEWKDRRPALELPRFAPTATALTRLAQEHGAGDLCLALDGSVALWRAGEGRLGYAPGGEGAPNTADLPPELFLDLRGAGQSKALEATYPPDFVLIVGGLRVATVRLDDLEPILVIEGEPFVLDEALVRKLTGGRYGLAWLSKFVLAPHAYQNDVDLDPRVVQLLREQAWRLWRLPGVERAEGSLRVKGPNAHLLPLLERAETVAGRRLPVRVDSYRFASVHRAMAPVRESAEVASAHAQLRRLREEIRAQARIQRKPDPWDGVQWSFLFPDHEVSASTLSDLSGVASRSVSFEDFQAALSRARLVGRIREVAPSLAQAYERELGRLFDADAKLGGAQTLLHDLARDVAKFERSVAESRSTLEQPDDEARQRAEDLRQKLQDDLRALDRRLEDERRRSRVGARPRLTEQTAVFVRNLPRELDPAARVYSAELGVVQTSELSGHVKEEGVPVAEATSFVPRSPLVTFGAVLRPRADVVSGRVQTGQDPGRDETKVPACLSDQESYYTGAFRRVARGRAEPIDVGTIPHGQGVPVERPDLVELVPLDGESNKAALDRTAQAVAEELFAKPDRIEAGKVSVARPWPVNTDGVVAGVEIAMRPNAKGFVTTIHLGSDAPPLAPLGETRVRPRRGAPSDAAAREGLTP